MQAGAIYSRAPVVVPPLGARAALHKMAAAACDWFAAIPPDGDALGNEDWSNCWRIAQQWCINLRRANAAGDTTRPIAADMIDGWARFNQFTPAPDDSNAPGPGTDTAKGMADWCANGIRVNSQTLDVPHWCIVDPTADQHVMLAIGHTGPVMATWDLCMALQDPENWPVAPGSSIDWTTPWAGHETCFGKTDGDQLVWTRTWGLDLEVHPDVRRKYCRQIDVPLDLSPGGWLRTTGLTPSGLDAAALRADMATLTA